MHQKYILSLAIAVILFFSVPLFYLFNYSQPVNTDNQKLVYDFPYPGILPDHPLYPVKIVRDRVLEFSTRDNIKKAQLYLLLSDKRLAMATSLADKGKRKLAVSTASKAEKYALKIAPVLTQSAEQGVPPQNRFIDQIKMSNKKHEEVIKKLMKDLSSEERAEIQQILELNQQVEEDLKTVKGV